MNSTVEELEREFTDWWADNVIPPERPEGFTALEEAEEMFCQYSEMDEDENVTEVMRYAADFSRRYREAAGMPAINLAVLAQTRFADALRHAIGALEEQGYDVEFEDKGSLKITRKE